MTTWWLTHPLFNTTPGKSMINGKASRFVVHAHEQASGTVTLKVAVCEWLCLHRSALSAARTNQQELPFRPIHEQNWWFCGTIPGAPMWLRSPQEGLAEVIFTNPFA